MQSGPHIRIVFNKLKKKKQTPFFLSTKSKSNPNISDNKLWSHFSNVLTVHDANTFGHDLTRNPVYAYLSQTEQFYPTIASLDPKKSKLPPLLQ